MGNAVILTVVEGVADVRLNRSEKHNAVDSDIMQGLLSVIEKVKADKTIRAVVLSGEGKSFCAGLDMASFGDMVNGDLDSDSVASAYDDISSSGANRVQQLCWSWQDVEVPVIAAIHGAALGGGLNLAMGADIRIAAPDAKLGFVEITFGLLPDMGATAALRHLVSLDKMKAWIFTGKKFTAEEALQEGLVTLISDSPLEEALLMAKNIANKNPDAIRGAKKLLNNSMLNSARDTLMEESNCSRQLMGTPNQIEAIMAGFEKRDPKFSD